MGTLGRNGRKYREFRAQVLAASNICIVCGEAIDMNLSGRHPRGPTIDHRIPLNLGGALMDPANAGPAHLQCNARKRDTVQRPQSREW